MKLMSDERGRLAGGGLFPPNATFEARTESDGTIRLVEVPDQEIPVVKARNIGGRWVGAEIALDRQTVAAAVRAERDAR